MLKKGLAPALGLVGYVGLFTIFILNIGKSFPDGDPKFAPLMVLTLFCFSALACSLIVFYKPALLFIDKKGKEAIELIVATTKWLGVLAVIIVAFVLIMS